MVHLSEEKLIQNRIFFRVRVVTPAAAILGESAFFVETSGRQIALPDLEKDGSRAPGSRDLLELFEELFSETPATLRIGNDDVFQLDLGVKGSSDEKRANPRAILDEQCDPAGSRIRENLCVSLP